MHGELDDQTYRRLEARQLDPLDTLDPWVADWAGARAGPLLVFGHITGATPLRRGRLVGVDTGCAHGRALTAYRYPDDDFVTVPAAGA